MRRDGVLLVAAFVAGLLSTAEALDDSPACGWPAGTCSVSRGSGAAVPPGDAAADARGGEVADDEVTGLSAWFEPSPPAAQSTTAGGR